MSDAFPPTFSLFTRMERMRAEVSGVAEPACREP